MPKSELEKFRTRWMRWLGKKTRVDKPYWVTLLDANWSGWMNGTRLRHGIESAYRNLFESTREKVKADWIAAIKVADMNDLRKLDGLYADEKYNRGMHR